MTKVLMLQKLFIMITLMTISSATIAKEISKNIHQIAQNVYSFSANGEYISMFVVTDDGVMVFETMNSYHAKAMISEIKKITDKPIRYAFHSHNHWDHASGGAPFIKAGATTLAHEEAYAWMKANPGGDMTLPTQTWSGNRKDITLGDTTVELHYLGMNHGLGMTIFVLPESKVAYVADIVTPNRVIFSVVPDFNLREWERSLAEVLALNFEKVVFSHNEKKHPLKAGNKADIASQLAYIRDLRAGFFAELKKGTNPMLIPKVLKLPKYKDWVGYDAWLEMNIWRVLADEFMGPFPWRPEQAESKQ